ncbi:MAG: hypothetical protein EAZ30_15815 [Betaproteobacteria bacterium]|nr:MAG: hypothetical protein EAZ30_15815 [Betaproteobacteria bacterium]
MVDSPKGQLTLSKHTCVVNYSLLSRDDSLSRDTLQSSSAIRDDFCAIAKRISVKNEENFRIRSL